MRLPLFRRFICWLALLFSWGTCIAASFEVVVLDPPNFGFNDETTVAPLQDNPGTTLGAQRLHVLEHAFGIWAQYLESDVLIRVEAEFQDLGGTADSLPLAGASTISVIRNFPNAPLSGVWYPVALANSLEGTDLSNSNDISVTINIAPDEDESLDDWYYGLDGLAPANEFDLLDVLLHELGHGLGFASYVDLQTGFFLQQTPDIYSLNLFDTEFGSGWADLNKRNLQLSAKNDPDLTWSGDYTTVASSYILEPELSIQVTSPESLIQEMAYVEALFGPSVPEVGIGGLLVVVDDATGTTSDACQTIVNSAALAGNIAYIDRGECNFDSKVLKAQQAGAIAVIIANNTSGGPVYMTGNDVIEGETLVIPAISISQQDGAILTSSQDVILTIGVPSSDLSGTNGGFVRIYAPDPLEQGSSVSHWSVDASPDLLMEPFINSNIREDLDLSLTLLKDIGWNVVNIPFPYLTYTLWAGEVFSPTETFAGIGDDPDRDGLLNIEEYFSGGNPALPSLDLVPRMQVFESDPEFVYTRATFFTDLQWEYEYSTALGEWLPAVEGVHYTEEIVDYLGNSTERVRLKVVAPLAGEKIFFRIRIDQE